MQDGQISQTLFNGTPEYRPLYFENNYFPAQGTRGSGIKDLPDLYEDAKIANQTGFTNWTNTFLQGLNETQVGIGASDLMDALVKKANIERQINQLDADYSTNGVNQAAYLQRKNGLLTDLQGVYNSIQSAQESIYEDKQDEARNPISKAFQFKTQQTMLAGSNASLMDQLKYSLPNVAGSSAATLGATLLSGYLGKVAMNTVQRGLAASTTGPWGTALGVFSGAATILGINAYARNLESKAEVGSQFLQDYENLRSEYLKGKPPGYEITDDEDNNLILQASKGSNDQYWKNMTLAVSDTIQSLIFAGAVGKAFRGISNYNKFSKLAALGAEYYANKKLEGLEEGLQYAFQTDKTLAAAGYKDSANFGESLFRNYRDAIGSMTWLGVKGKGAFSQDPDFEANVNAGELLGGVFGGTHTMFNVVKDVNAYRATTQELRDKNPIKSELPFLRFKDDLYAQFFGPKERGPLGILSEDSDDRVFYFKEALKNLTKRTFDDGTPFLTKEELSKELKDIDKAYEMFQSVNDNVDSILSPFGKKNKNQTELQKKVFRDELFHNSMTLARLDDTRATLESKMIANMDANGLNDLSRLEGKLSVVEERIPASNENSLAFLKGEKKILEKQISDLKKSFDILDEKPRVQPMDQASYKSTNDYYDSAESRFDYGVKRNSLSKVKSWPDLQKWYNGFTRTATESHIKKQEDALIEDNYQYATPLLENRQPINQLVDADKTARSKQNRETLDRAGFSKAYMDTLTEEDMDREAAKALEDFKNRVLNISDDTLLSTIVNSTSKDDINTYLSRPSIRAAFNRLGFNSADPLEKLQLEATTKLTALRDQFRSNKVRSPRPAGLQQATGNTAVVGRVKDKYDLRETPDYMSEFAINNGKAYQKDVLEGIIRSRFSTEPEKELARKLLSATTDEVIEFGANWREEGQTGFDTEGGVRKPGTTLLDADGNVRVKIDLGHFGDEIQGNQAENFAPTFETVVLHELVHRYTVQALRDDADTLQEVTRMLEKARQNAPAGYYGLRSPQEFVAEAMTSPLFQKFLTGIEGEGRKTLWQQFIGAVQSLLKRLFNVEVPTTLLEDVIAVSTNIIDGKKINTVNVVEKLSGEINTEMAKIDVTSKTASNDLASTYSQLQTKIITAATENNIGDLARDQLLDALTAATRDMENRIDAAKTKSNTVEFQGKTFQKGDWVVVEGTKGIRWVAGVEADGLITRNLDGSLKTIVRNVERLLFTGTREEAQQFADSIAGPEYSNNESQDLYKSITQEFDTKSGKFVETADPVKDNFFNFLGFLKDQNLAKTPYRGLLVQDDDAVAGFSIPRSELSNEWLKTHKPGQVVVVVDQQGNPVKFDNQFNPNPNGNYVVFTIETPDRVRDRLKSKTFTDTLMESKQISLKEAVALVNKVANNIASARRAASEGKPVFLNFTAVNTGVSVNEASKEIEMNPISLTDAERVVRLLEYFQTLPKARKDDRQKVKDFLFNYVIAKTPGYKMSGGIVKLNDQPVENIGAQDIIDNFDYKKVFDYLNKESSYQLLDARDGNIVSAGTFPSYAEYLMTISNLGSNLTRDRYNRYLRYEFGEKLEDAPKAPVAIVTPQVLPKKDIFTGDLFDVSLEETPEQPFNNDLGLFDNQTTADLVRSIDKGIHNYLRRGKELEGYVPTIIGAMEDRDFILNALNSVQPNILQQLAKLKDRRDAQFADGVIKQDYYQSQIDKINDKVNKLNNSWDKIVNYYIKNSEVFSYSRNLHFMYDEDGNLVQEGDDRKATNKGFDSVGNEISPIDGASKEIKALIRGLSKFKKIGETWIKPGNAFNVPQLVNFAVTWNNLLKNLQGLSTLEEKLNRLDTLSSKFPEYKELLQILRDYKDRAAGGELESILMLTKFERDFSNPEIPVFETIVDVTDDGTFYKVDEATRINVKDLKKTFLDNFRATSPYYVKFKDGSQGLSKKILQLPTVTKEQRVKFLEGLGFKFSEDTVNDPLFDIVASQQIISYFKDDIGVIQQHKVITDPITDLSRNTTYVRGQSKRLNDIINLESKYSTTTPTLSVQNVEGNTEYAISRPNSYSVVIKALNNSTRYPSFQDLVADEQFAYLNKPYARTSFELNSIFILDSKSNFGLRRTVNGKPVTLSLNNISGVRIEGGEGNKTTELFIGDKIASDFNQLLKVGWKEIMRAGDKNAAFGYKLSTFPQSTGYGYLPITDLRAFEKDYGGEQFYRIMEQYLSGEIMRVYLGRNGFLDNLFKMHDPKNNLADRLSLFAGIIVDQDLRTAFYSAVEGMGKLDPNTPEFYTAASAVAKTFMARPDMKKSLRDFMYNEVKLKLAALNKYGFYFSNRFWLDKQFQNVDPGTLLRSYIVNEFILNVEQTKLFNGDIVFYSTKDGDAHKRLPAMGATGVQPTTDRWFIEAMNTNPNTNLQAKNLNLNNQYSSILNTTVFREHNPNSVYIDGWKSYLKSTGLSDEAISRIVEPYNKIKEADAQGWVNMDYYRSFKISIGAWTLQQEKVYDKISEGKELTPEEAQDLHRIFPPIKAQYSGPIAHDYYHVPGFHKFSLMPLIPSAIKGTSLEALNERMLRNNVSYALMESGSKLGVIGERLEPFYSEESKDASGNRFPNRVMKAPTDRFDNINSIYTSFLKEQVQIEPDLHEEVIYGTQFRALLFQNVYDGGKEVNPNLARLERQYSGIIDEITEYEKKILEEDMGIIPHYEDGKLKDYTVKDQAKLLDRISQEVERRRLNNSIKDFFDLEDGKLKYPLDASINHQQVRTLILSMINNRLIRQTIKGDMLILGASTGYEKFSKPTEKDLNEYGTNGLRFYYIKDGKVRKMQVKVALTGDFTHLLNYSWNGEKIKTRERLNQALKDQAWVEANNKSISMIGYRIPTQGLNSIEAMEIAEFLPPETGNILIVPTEIVTKSGADFDIDKLNVFKPSLTTVRGEGQYIERTKFKATKKTITEPIDSELDSLKARKKPFNMLAKFVNEVTTKLKIDDPALVEKLNATITKIFDLKTQIDTTQATIDNLTDELRAAFDSDKNFVLMGEKSDQTELKIELADQLDNLDKLKRSLLLEQFNETEVAKMEDILDDIADSVYEEQTQYNNNIQAQIDALIQARRSAIDNVRNYKAGLFNAIIETATERILDKNSFPELITPNSVDLLKPKVQEISRKMGTEKKNYLHTNNLTSSTQEEKFLAAIPNKKALGIAAVGNKLAQLFMKSGLKINELFNGRPTFHPMINGRSMSDLYLKDGILKSEIFSQMINAYVDVLNDDFISKANLSADTAGVFFYLLHMGHSKDQLFDFFNNPVIRAYIQEIQKSKSLIKYRYDLNTKKQEFTTDQEDENSAPIGDPESIVRASARLEAFINSIDGNFEALRSTKLGVLRQLGMDYAKKNTDIFKADHLSEAVGKQLTDIPYEERQAILSYYLSALEESRDLLKLQMVNNYDTTTSVNPIANDYRELLKLQLEKNDLFSSTDVTTPTVIKPFNQFNLIDTVLNTLMPNTLNSSSRGQIVKMLSEIGSNADVDKLSRTFINDFLAFIASNFGEVNGQRLGEYGRNLLFKVGEDNRLANTLLEFRNDPKWKNLRDDYPIINNLRVDSVGNLSNIALYREDNSTDYQNVLIEQLQKLAAYNEVGYTDEDKAKIRQFTRDLVILGFVQSGLNKSPISFTDVIPNEYYAPMMTAALDKYNELSKEEKNALFFTFVGKFRVANTQLFGNPPNPIPYWRYKNYLVDLATKSKTSLDNGLTFQEDQSSGYAARTKVNASADATIAIATDFNSAGEKLTKSSVLGQGKLYIPINYSGKTEASQQVVDAVVSRLNSVNARTLNIAGNGIYTMKTMTQDQVDSYVYDLLRKITTSPSLKTKIESIRTGGQTGFDEAGAKAGMRLGIPTTILAPKGWKFRNIQGQDISNEAQFKARFNQNGNIAIKVKPNEKDEYNIWAGTKENGILSNIAVRPFVIGGDRFNSVEQYFQYQKWNYLKEGISKAEHDKNAEIANKIMDSNNPYEIKQLGKRFTALDQEAWNKNSSKEMKVALKASFEQNPSALANLLATGTANLTHTQDRGKWKTEFPRLLMEVRSELGGTKPGDQLKMFDTSLDERFPPYNISDGDLQALTDNLLNDDMITKCK